MNERLTETLNYIRTNSQLCAHTSSVQVSAFTRQQDRAINKHYAKMIEDKILTAGIARGALDKALALGESGQDSVERKEQRRIIRSILLAEMTVRGRPLSEAKTLRTKYLAINDTGALQRAFRAQFPSILSVQGRSAWSPSNFTDPKSLAPFKDIAKLKPPVVITRDGRGGAFTFLITSLPSDTRAIPTLNDFDASIYKWMAVSTSVISAGNAIIYGYVGLIPAPCDADSRWGFTERLRHDS